MYCNGVLIVRDESVREVGGRGIIITLYEYRIKCKTKNNSNTRIIIRTLQRNNNSNYLFFSFKSLCIFLQ